MNTIEKLSWTLLGVALFFGIAAVSTDTSFFKNASLTGWLSLSGATNRLTVADGALELDGTPIAEAADPFVVTSALADNPTNVAMVVNTDEEWTGGKLLSLRNNGDEQMILKRDGAINIGKQYAQPEGDDYTLWSWREGAEAVNYFDFYATSSTNYEYFGEITGEINNDQTAPTSRIVVKAKPEGVSSTLVQVYAGGDSSGVYITGSRNFTALQPESGATTASYNFDTKNSHSSGSLAVFENNNTNKFSITWDGAVTAAMSPSGPSAPAAGYYTLFATNNGSGKMVLKVQFPTGDSQVIATEP